MMKAVEKYDIDNPRKASFFTYSYFWIKSGIQDCKYQSKNFIRIPEKKRDKVEVKVNSLDAEDFDWFQA